MPKLHLKQPGFCYSACGPFTKHREKIQKFKKTVNLIISIKTKQKKLVLFMTQGMLVVKI